MDIYTDTEERSSRNRAEILGAVPSTSRDRLDEGKEFRKGNDDGRFRE